MGEKIFVPHELRTIEVDVEKKSFKVNGEDFGHGCTRFSICCDGYNDFHIRLDLDTTIHFATYEGTALKTVSGRQRGPLD